MKKQLSAVNLKEVLFDTLQDVRARKVTVGEAAAAAKVSREIIRAVLTQIKVSEHTKRKLPNEVIRFSENA